MAMTRNKCGREKLRALPQLLSPPRPLGLCATDLGQSHAMHGHIGSARGRPQDPPLRSTTTYTAGAPGCVQGAWLLAFLLRRPLKDLLRPPLPLGPGRFLSADRVRRRTDL